MTVGAPVAIQGDLTNLPDALQPLTVLPYWVLWKWKERNGRRTKVPYQPGGEKAKSNDRETWSTYDAVIRVLSDFDGIGFMLAEHGAFDIDDCRDPVTGTVKAWAEQLVAEVGSYAEITISGTGLRSWQVSDLAVGEGEALADYALRVALHLADRAAREVTV